MDDNRSTCAERTPNQATQPPHSVDQSGTSYRSGNLYAYLDSGVLSLSGNAKPSEYLKEEFDAIRDSAKNIRLPAGLKLSNSYTTHNETR